MRQARIKESGPGYYHVISRVVDRRHAIDQVEKERFCSLMRQMEGFSGCQVLTYAVLDNHFHILLFVPQRETVSDELFLRRLGCLYEEQAVRAIGEQLQHLRQAGQAEAAEALREGYTYRMYDLSEFVKTLKQRFTQGYNRRHERRGTLWESRFKSVLLDGRGATLSATAAYVDLNAVRAGLVRDPKDYRFSGYGEAVAGSALARHGLGQVMGLPAAAGDWERVAAAYRELLYVRGQEQGAGDGGQAGFSAEQVRAVLAQGGRLALPEVLRCRVRYFTDGCVLGSQAFVEDVFLRHRAKFGARRRTLARTMRGADWGEMRSARRLRVNVISLPVPAPGRSAA